jgi:capsular polysaccharide biosynthesis protein
MRRWRPAIDIHEDVVALPFVSGGRWGVFDSQGRPLPGSVDRRGLEQATIEQDAADPRPYVGPLLEMPDPEYVYAGRLIHHYGHFLFESLSRLWPWIDGGLRGRKLLVHPVGAPTFFANLPYASAILGALGLQQSDFVVVDAPMRIRRLIVPHPAVSVDAYAHVDFRRLCRRIGGRLHPAPRLRSILRRRRTGPPVYLSKRWLVSGVQKLENEVELEPVLQRAGVQVVYPELMPFAEQVALWAERPTILGTVGSALHTSIFAPPPSQIVGLLLGAEAPGSHQLVDTLNGNPTRYFRPEGVQETRPEPGRFAAQYRLREPDRIARALLDLIM